jgi:hypothetical protein
MHFILTQIIQRILPQLYRNGYKNIALANSLLLEKFLAGHGMIAA